MADGERETAVDAPVIHLEIAGSFGRGVVLRSEVELSAEFPRAHVREGVFDAAAEDAVNVGVVLNVPAVEAVEHSDGPLSVGEHVALGRLAAGRERSRSDCDGRYECSKNLIHLDLPW